ncbi:MAG: hypothetical protein K8R12_01520, partial [Desulfobacterales bacterium]|nr:hypothetical protein [Desulfobacterales bacterium]
WGVLLKNTSSHKNQQVLSERLSFISLCRRRGHPFSRGYAKAGPTMVGFLLLSVERTENNRNQPLWGIPDKKGGR